MIEQREPHRRSLVSEPAHFPRNLIQRLRQVLKIRDLQRSVIPFGENGSDLLDTTLDAIGRPSKTSAHIVRLPCVDAKYVPTDRARKGLHGASVVATDSEQPPHSLQGK